MVKNSPKPKGKPLRAKKPAKKKNACKARRLPISAKRVKELGYASKNIIEADQSAGLAKPLAELIERYSQLDEAWNRGQFLRNLQECARTVMTVTQAARHLGFEKGQELREVLDTDQEARDVWQQARIATIAESKEAIVEAVKTGNQAAIRAVERFMSDEEEGASGTVDFSRLPMNRVADVFCVTRQTVYDWYNKNQLPRNGDGSFDLKTTIRWFEEFTLRKASRGKDILENPDALRKIKAEKMQVELAARKGELLDRISVIEGFAARWRNLVNSLNKLPREIATMLENQTESRICEVLETFVGEVLSQQKKIPSELLLSDEEKAKMTELLDMILPDESEAV